MGKTGMSEKAKLWTGRWLPNGRPECVEVPVAARINGGRGAAHYLAKGFKPLEAIPPEPDGTAKREGAKGPVARKGGRRK